MGAPYTSHTPRPHRRAVAFGVVEDLSGEDEAREDDREVRRFHPRR